RAEGQCDEAISEFEMVTASNPNSAAAFFALGVCKLVTGSIDETIPLEEQAPSRHGGTSGSNPACSSEESSANVTQRKVSKPAMAFSLPAGREPCTYGRTLMPVARQRNSWG